MIKREHYIKQIRGFYDSDLIKVITGIRRCGKSVILEEIKDEISKTSANIIYLNFENVIIADKISNGKELLNYVNEHKKEGKCYIFLDEIQNIDGRAEAVKTLRLSDNSVFISGSNSKLLSNEFLNQLSGRFVSFRVRQFVYKEIIEYSRELNFTPDIGDYLIWGGFPKRFEFKTKEDQRRYLNDLDSTIVIHDPISRYGIKKRLYSRNSQIMSYAAILGFSQQNPYTIT